MQFSYTFVNVFCFLIVRLAANLKSAVPELYLGQAGASSIRDVSIRAFLGEPCNGRFSKIWGAENSLALSLVRCLVSTN